MNRGKNIADKLVTKDTTLIVKRKQHRSEPTIIDLLKDQKPSMIEADRDLIKSYYEERAKKYGFK